MQTSPGSQINWLLQPQPLSPGGDRQRLSACLQPGARVLGCKAYGPNPSTLGHPQQAPPFLLCSSLLMPLIFNFLFLPLIMIPMSFCKFLLCVSPPNGCGLA